MARLLVSVRSADEARRALEAGAHVIDVKEPDRGSLGRAEFSVWNEVRAAVPPPVPLSVALGELTEWRAPHAPVVPALAWSGLTFRKLGLAGSGPNWRRDWQALRHQLGAQHSPAWVAVAYADWRRAAAPSPEAVLEAALDAPEIVGLLVDTWSKTERFRPDDRWIGWAHRVRQAGRLLALAGGVDWLSAPSLALLFPDLIAVRGAACVDGRRDGTVDPIRVARLAAAAAELPVANDALPWFSTLAVRTPDRNARPVQAAAPLRS